MVTAEVKEPASEDVDTMPAPVENTPPAHVSTLQLPVETSPAPVHAATRTITLPSRNPPAMGVKQGSPFRAGPVSEMELFKSVPVLTGESNYREWVTALKRVLEPINVNCFRVLNGDWPKPVFENEEANPEQFAECIQYGSTNTDLLLVINATIHQSVQSHIWNTFDGRSAFLALEEAFASPIRGTRFANYSNWVTTLYTSNNPEEFVRKWRRALEELHGWNDLANMSYTFVVCQFLVAVGCNPPARAWVKGLRLNVEYCDEAVLDNLIVDFLDFEDQRLKPPQVLLPALYSCVSRNDV